MTKPAFNPVNISHFREWTVGGVGEEKEKERRRQDLAEFVSLRAETQGRGNTQHSVCLCLLSPQ